jgi:hypothetical protein
VTGVLTGMGVHRSLTTPTHDSESLIRGRGGSRVAGGTVRRHRPMIMTVKLPRRSERCDVEASTSCHSERSAEARGRPRSGQMRNRDRPGRGLSGGPLLGKRGSRGAAENIGVEMRVPAHRSPPPTTPNLSLLLRRTESFAGSSPPRAPRLRVNPAVRPRRTDLCKGLWKGVRLLFEGVRLLDPPDESRSLTPDPPRSLTPYPPRSLTPFSRSSRSGRSRFLESLRSLGMTLFSAASR